MSYNFQKNKQIGKLKFDMNGGFRLSIFSKYSPHDVTSSPGTECPQKASNETK